MGTKGTDMRLDRGTRNVGIASLVLACSLLTATPAEAGCTRHVYNKSKDVWVMSIERDGKPYKEFRIRPGQNASFIMHGGWTKANIRFRTDLYDESFHLQDVRSKDCYLIKHTGITGRAVLNEPADGDAILID